MSTTTVRDEAKAQGPATAPAEDPMQGWRPAVVLSIIAGILGASAAAWAMWLVRDRTATVTALAVIEAVSVVFGVWSGILRRGSVEAGIAELNRKARSNATTMERLEGEREVLTARQQALADEEAALHERTRYTFVNLSMRTLTLVERQLDLIDRLEHGEDDPDRLEDLFRLDHLATRMRRNGENILVIAGADERHSYQPPTPLLDVVRAAVSEIERYERVDVGHLPAVDVTGHTADDLSHLLAELLENSTAYSAPEARVQVTGRSLENGSIVLSVDDEGIGMPTDHLVQLNNRLQGDATAASDPGDTGLGGFVVGALSQRHGLRAQLRPRPGGGLTAMIVVPASIFVGGKPSAAEISEERDRERKRANAAAVAATTPEAKAVPAPDGPVEASTAQSVAEGEAERPTGKPHPAGGPAGRRSFRHPLTKRIPQPTVEEPTQAEASTPAAEPAVSSDASIAFAAPQPAIGRTTKGLPKRITTPTDTGHTPPAGIAAVRVPAEDPKPVPAEELRRRLSGFQQGLAEGRAEDDVPGGDTTEHAPADDAAGSQGGAAR